MRFAPTAALLCGAALLLSAPAARAQDMPVMDWIGPQIQADRAGVLYRHLLDIDDAPAGKTAARRPAAKAAAVSSAYVPTPALRQQTVANYAAFLEKSNPAAAQGLLAGFGPGKTDYGTVYGKLTEGWGLRPNDAADAVAVFLVLGHRIAIAGQDYQAISKPMVGQARSQVRAMLAGNPKKVAGGGAARMGEAAKLQAVFLEAGWLSATQQHTTPAYRQTVAALFQNQYGLNLSQFTLTDRGFAKK